MDYEILAGAAGVLWLVFLLVLRAHWKTLNSAERIGLSVIKSTEGLQK